ncbi:MAG: hypothetical protein KAG61_09005, partial [Bacteriovoracaceae bacterium]|nr:hypothetical protein [Bacteriovoracaceae bacterium]
AIAEEFVDYPIYLEMGLWPTLKFGPFGISAFTNVSNSLMIKNSIHPIFDINYKRDNGVIFGYAQRFGSAAQSGKNILSLGQGNLFSVGVSLKYIQRESIHAQYDVFGPTLLGQITGGDFSDLSDVKNMLGYAIGKGYGADTGVEYSLIGDRTQFTTGFSVMDIGGTLFKKTEGPGEIDRQEMRMNFGTAFSQDFYIVDYRVAFDIHPINDETLDFSSKLHFGLDLGMPLVRILMGYNAGYMSYGVKMSLWPVELIVGLYGIETGYQYRQREAKRAVIYLSLLDFSIDA